MKRIWTLWWIGFSLALTACASAPPFQGDTLCTLQPILISQEVRTHLRASVAGQLDASVGAPAGYTRFLQDIAAHNAKIAAHCGGERPS